MNLIRTAGMDLAAHANLFECVSLALDLSEIRDTEIEVLREGVKIAGFRNGHRVFPPSSSRPRPDTLDLGALQAGAVERALRQTNGNVAEAAKLLGKGRTTLYRWMQEHRIAVPLASAA